VKSHQIGRKQNEMMLEDSYESFSGAMIVLTLALGEPASPLCKNFLVSVKKPAVSFQTFGKEHPDI
jgi:hypothetical protein